MEKNALLHGFVPPRPRVLCVFLIACVRNCMQSFMVFVKNHP